MGYRLHYAKKYEVRYSESGFNHLQEPINTLLYELSDGFDYFEGQVYQYAENFEINKKSLAMAIEELKKWSDDMLPSEIIDEGYNVDSIVALLNESLERSDANNDYVVFAWY